MVLDLKKIESHKGKPLSVHILGVYEKAERRNKSLFLKLAILFHDLGKINPNFQDKLNGIKNSNYSQHAYISAYAFLKFYQANTEYFNVQLNGDINRVKSIVAIIAKHHGHLPNLNKALKDSPLDDLEDYVEINSNLPFDQYLIKELSFLCNSFDLKFDTKLVRKAFIKKHSERKSWQQNALDYFFQTQYDFSCLIEADKRDAGRMGMDIWWDIAEHSNKKLKNALTKTFVQFEKGEVSSLNQVRTALRLEAENNITGLLKEGYRTFNLTAPTGAGKTFTMLAIAKQIQEVDSKLGIIYCLPFLSIIEQVESICENDLKLDLLSATSKSQNKTIEAIQESLDRQPDDKKLKTLLREIYKANTFDYPFILTTFVQFFETLVSNRNSTLLKLPNFANRIFLIDEIQSLPPRLYIFFAAWLDHFCRQNNSYVVFSSATMPYFKIPNKSSGKPALARKTFRNYIPPVSIIQPKKYFGEQVFNRYEIQNLTATPFSVKDLAQHIIKQDQSCLVILNLIEDTKLLLQALENYPVHKILLNTHFMPIDRLAKIKEAKDYLSKGERVILISTQLIEAGVDISFPIAYRDLCPLPSLIQSAGRCNRSGEFEAKGLIYFIELEKEKNGKIKTSAHSIYRNGADKNFLNNTKNKLPNLISEKELFNFQESFFKDLSEKLIIGDFIISGEKSPVNMIECINQAEFETLGRFRMIQEKDFGEKFSYYIRKDLDDTTYEHLEELVKTLSQAEGYEAFARIKEKINGHIKEMRQRIVTIRVYGKDPNTLAPAWSNQENILYDIRVLADLSAYTYEKGIDLTTENQFI